MSNPLSPVHSDRLSEQELQDIRERCEKASAGPWQTFYTTPSGLLPDVVDADLNHIAAAWGHDGMKGIQARENGDFIAHARSDIPKLLSELSRLRSERVTLADKIEEAIKLAAHLGDNAFDFIEGRGLHQIRLEIRQELTGEVLTEEETGR